jgi:hypothetical protein
MATEKIDCTEARRQAIHELRLAILALECGEMTSAENHAFSAIAWVREIV